jgi:uncharacterized protein YcbX
MFDADREWLITNAQYRFRTGRNFPRMLNLQCSFTDDSHRVIRVQAINKLDQDDADEQWQQPLFLPTDESLLPSTDAASFERASASPTPVPVVVWNVECHNAVDMGDVAAEWVTRMLGKSSNASEPNTPLRLVRISSALPARRVAQPEVKAQFCIDPTKDVTGCMTHKHQHESE